MANFQVGGEAAQEYEDEQKAKGGNFARTNYFRLENKGDTAVLRFITDEPFWPRVMQHQSVPTKNPPADYTGGNWPKSMGAVCRMDKGFTNPDGSKDHADCYICDHQEELKNQWGRKPKATQRIWALACVRVAVHDEAGVFKGYKDDMIDVPVIGPDGKPVEGQTQKVRNIVVVNYAMKNFFSALLGLKGVYGTITDRDYIIKRSGEGTDVEYQPIPLDPINAAMPDGSAMVLSGEYTFQGQHHPAHPQWQRYLDAVEALHLDLFKIIEERASDEFFARFFDPTKTAPPRANADGSTPQTAAEPGTNQGASAEQQGAAPSNEVQPDRLQAMRDRVRSQPGATGVAAPASEPAQEPAGEPVGAGVGAAAPSAPMDLG